MKIIKSKNAPIPVWPYSLWVEIWNLIFLSWQIWIDPKFWVLQDWIEKQTMQIIENIWNILKDNWLWFENVIKTTIFLKNIQDFQIVNEIYWNYFIQKPARSTVEVSNLPKNAQIEIECICSKTI